MTHLYMKNVPCLNQTLAPVFSCEFCEICKNTFSIRALLVTASDILVLNKKLRVKIFFVIKPKQKLFRESRTHFFRYQEKVSKDEISNKIYDIQSSQKSQEHCEDVDNSGVIRTTNIQQFFKKRAQWQYLDYEL